MPLLERALIVLLLYVALPLLVVVLAVGPKRFWRGLGRAWAWVWGGRQDPETLLARVVKQCQEHIGEAKKALKQAETVETEIVRNLGKSEESLPRLEQEARDQVQRGDDERARAALYKLNLERQAVQSFREQLDRQRQHLIEARRRIYLLELQLRQYEVGRSILLSQLAEARTIQQQYEIAKGFDPFNAVADWQRAEGMVQDEALGARAVEQVQLDLADNPLAGPQAAAIDPALLDAQLAELKARSERGQAARNGPRKKVNERLN